MYAGLAPLPFSSQGCGCSPRHTKHCHFQDHPRGNVDNQRRIGGRDEEHGRWRLAVQGQRYGWACDGQGRACFRGRTLFLLRGEASRPAMSHRPLAVRRNRMWDAQGFASCASYPTGRGPAFSSHISTYMNSKALYGRSRSPCLARATDSVPLQGCCLLVGVPTHGLCSCCILCDRNVPMVV